MQANPMNELSRLFQSGLASLQRGQAAAAKDIFNQLLAKAPNHPEVCHYLALSEYQTGNHGKAETLLRRALKIKPDYWQAHNNLGVILKEQGKLEHAKTAYKKLLKHVPDYADARSNLGIVLNELGDENAAKEQFEAAIGLQANHADANNALGVIYRNQGDTQAAINCFKKAISVAPNHAEAQNNLGNAYQSVGNIDEAIKQFSLALKVNPRYAEAHCNLGTAYQNVGRLLDAKRSFETALKIDPGNAEFLFKLAWNYHERCEYSEASKYYQETLRIDEHHLDAHSNLLMLNNYIPELSRDALFRLHQDWEKRLPEHLKRVQSKAKAADLAVKKKYRIGYVSPDFRRHSVAFFFEPLLENHNRDRFEIHCYYNNHLEDDVTEGLKALADGWVNTLNMDDQTLAEKIRQDGIDILVDLAGHTALNRLRTFALAPAPVQLSWLGYPNTTGLSTIAYRISDAFADPEGHSEAFHSEEVLRMPKGFLCYKSKEQVPVERKSGAKDKAATTFGSFNYLPKVNSHVVKTWATLLKRMPEARLLIKSKQLADAGIRESFLRQFTEWGVKKDQLDLRASTVSAEEHLDLYNEVDIALDPFPYNGTTTTFEALWMGVPVLTLCGEAHASRVGYSILSQLGMDEWVAHSEEEYIEKAITLSQQKKALGQLKRELRQNLADSHLCDGQRFTADYEAQLEGVIKTLAR